MQDYITDAMNLIEKYNSVLNRTMHEGGFILRAGGDPEILQSAERLYICFVDYKCAFDIIKHKLMIQILNEIKVD